MTLDPRTWHRKGEREGGQGGNWVWLHQKGTGLPVSPKTQGSAATQKQHPSPSSRFSPIPPHLLVAVLFFELRSAGLRWKHLSTTYRVQNKPCPNSPLVSSPRCLRLGVFCRFLNYFSDYYCIKGVCAHCLVKFRVFSRSL